MHCAFTIIRRHFDGAASLLVKSCSVDKFAFLYWYTVWCVASLSIIQDCHITQQASVLRLVLEIRRLSCFHLPIPGMLRQLSGVTRRFLIGRSTLVLQAWFSRRPLCGVFCNFSREQIGNQSYDVALWGKELWWLCVQICLIFLSWA